MCFQTPMKGLGMITIERKYYSTKINWAKRISNSIVLASTYGLTLPWAVMKAMMTVLEDSLQFIEMYSKKSKLNKPKHITPDKT